ncbi:proline-rich protein 2-like [Choloepus didactylus]|uniref:proline-rich protein 2-like n=1 Tax=Choloepus didactylus TaxID=27675 RepID=UPI00189F2398|nr:proline-rich protein 2-like [Choloepus didactylus]
MGAAAGPPTWAGPAPPPHRPPARATAIHKGRRRNKGPGARGSGPRPPGGRPRAGRGRRPLSRARGQEAAGPSRRSRPGSSRKRKRSGPRASWPALAGAGPGDVAGPRAPTSRCHLALPRPCPPGQARVPRRARPGRDVTRRPRLRPRAPLPAAEKSCSLASVSPVGLHLGGIQQGHSSPSLPASWWAQPPYLWVRKTEAATGCWPPRGTAETCRSLWGGHSDDQVGAGGRKGDPGLRSPPTPAPAYLDG